MKTKMTAKPKRRLPENTQKTGDAKRETRGGKRSTSWKPGESGNPNGAPRKGMSWRELIAQIGDEIKASGKYAGMTWKEAVVRVAYVQAVSGNIFMFRELMQHGEPQAQEINLNVHDAEQIRRERWQQFAPTLSAALRDPNETADTSKSNE
jgi:hypothetical protein